MTNSTRSSARQKFVKEAAELIAQAPTLFSENKKLKENIKSVTEDRDAILNAKLRADQIIKKLKESNAELLEAMQYEAYTLRTAAKHSVDIAAEIFLNGSAKRLEEAISNDLNGA